MTPDDLEFMREQRRKIDACPNIDCESCPDRERLLNLLIEAEAMREKAEFWHIHRVSFGHCVICDLKRSKHHSWPDTDWIEAKRKEWRINDPQSKKD